MKYLDYMNKANRDAVWFSLPREERANLRRVCYRNQCMHPQYIADYEKETGTKLAPEDKGFGNDIYKTFFAAVYTIVRVL